jgi:hypothetical protein
MATLITFLISAIGHEIVMACITKKMRGYGFLAQMSQLPIMMIQRSKYIRGKKVLGTVCFWCSMILGLSMVSFRPYFSANDQLANLSRFVRSMSFSKVVCTGYSRYVI